MALDSLEELVKSTDNIVQMLRENGEDYTEEFPVVPNEFTHWLDEQRAITETCALSDLSYHMCTIDIEGPDASAFLNDLSVNSFSDFEVGRGKQLVFCNQQGHLMDDGPFLRLGEDKYWGVLFVTYDWLEYCAETGDYDITTNFDPPSHKQDGDPKEFIIQLQGPNTHEVLKELTDDSLSDLPFYNFTNITLAGREIRAFGHGMNTEEGCEFHGPYEHAEEIREAIVKAGEDHGLRRLGSKAYLTHSVRLGWVPAGPPPVYDVDEMADYRQWLDTDSLAATYSIEGSFESNDISDYYMSPVEQGYGKLVTFDHDFIGRDSVEEEMENPERELVSLFWDTDDVMEVQRSLFEEGENYKYMELPRIAWARAAFDKVQKGGELVGVSHTRCYERDVRNMVSLAVIDTEFSDLGTEVTVVWGEGSDSPNPKHEKSIQKEISATVRQVPYTADKRKVKP